MGRHDGDLRFLRRINAKQSHANDCTVVHHHGLGFEEGRGVTNVGITLQLRQQPWHTTSTRFIEHDDLGHAAQNALPQRTAKTVHDAEHGNQYGHAKRQSRDGTHCNKGDATTALPRTQVTPTDS